MQDRHHRGRNGWCGRNNNVGDACSRRHTASVTLSWIERSSQWKNTLNLVFVTETGAPVHSSDLIQHFKRMLKTLELPKIRFHDLRHTATTLMLADGVPLVTVSKILGHSSPAITATIYAHALDESKTGAIAGLSQKLRGAPAVTTQSTTQSAPDTKPAPPDGERGIPHSAVVPETGLEPVRMISPTVFKPLNRCGWTMSIVVFSHHKAKDTYRLLVPYGPS